jgi:hypothetical protein
MDGGAVMKRTLIAMFGLAMALSVAVPSRANAEVVVQFNVGPGYARPAYGYIYAHPRPYYYARPYAYAPAYVYPSYGYRGYDRFDRDRRYDRDDRRDWNRRDRDDDDDRGRGNDREHWRR